MSSNQPNLVPYSSFMANDEVARAYQEYMGAGTNPGNSNAATAGSSTGQAAANNTQAQQQAQMQAAQQCMQNFGGFTGFGGWGYGFPAWGQFPTV